MSGILSANGGAEIVTRSQLALIEPPPGTDTFRPVKHAELVDELEAGLARHHFSIERMQLAIQNKGMLFFATFDLASDLVDFRPAIGVRSSNNKVFPIQLAVGLTVFVCDNLCFSGDIIAFKRKHTSGLSLPREMDRAINYFQKKFDVFQGQVAEMQDAFLSVPRAKELIYDAVITRELFPVRMLPKINEEYFHPRHAEFRNPSAWALENAMTEVAKELPERSRFRTLHGIGKLFSELLS